MNKRKCLDCGQPIEGRSDKKFCDDQCRNNYNNRLNSDEGALMKRINNILRKNKRILKELNLTDKPITVHKSKLDEKGFNYKYFTHIYNTKKGSSYFFIYDFGYQKLENDIYMIVSQNN